MTTKSKSQLLSAAACCAWIAACLVLLPATAHPKGPKGHKRPPVSAPLKEAKLNIEHNATDHDTGFQGAVDSEGWDRLEMVGPRGVVLSLEGRGPLAELGLTELFFETVEPENADIPIEELLEDVPAGLYTFRGRTMIDGESSGETIGTASFTHDIPAGPALMAPAKGAVVPADELTIRWGAVTQSLRGGPIKIIAYQLIVEKDVPPHPNMIGKWGLSMYLPSSATSMTVPRGFLEPNTKYLWEVLAIEESGNQTLSSSDFRTN